MAAGDRYLNSHLEYSSYSKCFNVVASYNPMAYNSECLRHLELAFASILPHSLTTISETQGHIRRRPENSRPRKAL